MYDCDGEGRVERDVIGRLGSATDCVRRRSRTANPVALRDELIRLRRIVDRIELEFATVAGAFAATEEEEWQGCLSPLHWMRLECGMSAAAASSGFAHLALMAGTARAFQASPTAIPLEEQPLLDQAVNHTLSRFRADCGGSPVSRDRSVPRLRRGDPDYRRVRDGSCSEQSFYGAGLGACLLSSEPATSCVARVGIGEKEGSTRWQDQRPHPASAAGQQMRPERLCATPNARWPLQAPVCSQSHLS